MKSFKLLSNKNVFFDDVRIFVPSIFEDNRGYFYESWNKELLNLELHDINFCQENHSFSKKNVLRGMHFQINPFAQGKLVECLFGKIYDVVIDLRIKSPTFMHWGGIELSGENHKQIWLGKGFAHGFYTLSEDAHVIYKVDNYWEKESERTIFWNDSELSINWPLKDLNPILSKKDSAGKKMNDLSKKEYF